MFFSRLSSTSLGFLVLLSAVVYFFGRSCSSLSCLVLLGAVSFFSRLSSTSWGCLVLLSAVLYFLGLSRSSLSCLDFFRLSRIYFSCHVLSLAVLYLFRQSRTFFNQLYRLFRNSGHWNQNILRKSCLKKQMEKWIMNNRSILLQKTEVLKLSKNKQTNSICIVFCVK